MKTLILLVLAMIAITCSYGMTTQVAIQKFVEFQHKFNKTYSNQEYGKRFLIFKENLEKAEIRTARAHGKTTFGMTKFSDLTDLEFKNMYLMPKFTANDFPKAPLAKIKNKGSVKLPGDFDWNSKGAITPVYDQGQCGSCWAFSATETIESYWFLAGNTLTQLSMQQIVDCDTTDQGCNGGWTYDAYQYVQSAGGLEPLSDYPYTAQDGSCAFNQQEVLAQITGWQYVTQSQDENAMQTWMTNSGPISICVDASSWSSYTGGVYMAADCTTNLDHCVQATGYSNQQGTQAWNVRNSWGADWGVNGYIYLQFGADTCGLAQVPTSVTAS